MKFRYLITLALFAALFALPATAAIYVKIDSIEGDVTPGPDRTGGWFVADSFSFAVEREMKESGEKGGTEDINIGIGELQECTLSKRMDRASPALAQASVGGRSAGSCQVCLSASEVGGVPSCYAHFVMERCYVKSWSTSGDADDRPTEEVALYFNKIAFGYDDAGRITSMSWDQERNVLWLDGLDWLFDFGGAPR